jgi:hypothetical protein
LLLQFIFRRRAKEAPEIRAARKLLRSAASGIPAIHGPINRVLVGLGLELKRTETPTEKVARIRLAIERHDQERKLSGRNQSAELLPKLPARQSANKQKVD